jgi:FkbM family methyltransferase
MTFERILPRIAHRLTRLRFAPSIDVAPSRELARLGTKYGGWVLEPSPDLQHATIISCGLGEDASFDVEFAARFQSRVVLVDPTPRAIAHFAAIRDRLGQPATDRYALGGAQPITAYDLSSLTSESLVLEPFAVWTNKTTLNFFAPTNPEHVSHSLIDSPRSRSNIDHLAVGTVTLLDLFRKHCAPVPPLIKLDVEGAETPILLDLLSKGVCPRQLLIEIDELNRPSRQSKHAAEKIDASLRRAGYGCRFFDGHANFLYVREP